MTITFFRDSKGRFARHPLSTAKVRNRKKKAKVEPTVTPSSFFPELDLKSNLGDASEVVFVFDTTGSMNPCIQNVRTHITKTCEDLFRDLPGIRIGLIAHGDYCDGDRCITKLLLTDKQEDILHFVKTVPNTSGGDAPECYELALNIARGMGWTKDKKGKVLVMIGDDEPHPVNYHQNVNKLDWRNELRELKELGVTVYSLQCLYQTYRDGANQFWAAIAAVFGTPLLKLNDMGNSTDILKAAAYASAGPTGSKIYSSSLSPDCAPEVKTCARIFIRESTKFSK